MGKMMVGRWPLPVGECTAPILDADPERRKRVDDLARLLRAELFTERGDPAEAAREDARLMAEFAPLRMAANGHEEDGHAME